jgi:hypothetical protein
MGQFLYDDDAHVVNTAIYTIGKFSQAENAHFLETAFHRRFKDGNPALAARCLFELQWLKSSCEERLADLDIEGIVEELRAKGTIASHLVLLLFFESTCANERTRKLLETSAVKPFFNEKESVEIQLWRLEQLVSQHCTASGSAIIEPSVLESVLKNMSGSCPSKQITGNQVTTQPPKF